MRQLKRVVSAVVVVITLTGLAAPAVAQGGGEFVIEAFGKAVLSTVLKMAYEDLVDLNRSQRKWQASVHQQALEREPHDPKSWWASAGGPDAVNLTVGKDYNAIPYLVFWDRPDHRGVRVVRYFRLNREGTELIRFCSGSECLMLNQGIFRTDKPSWNCAQTIAGAKKNACGRGVSDVTVISDKAY